MRKILIVLVQTLVTSLTLRAETLEKVFANPPQEARPIMIWQWMDGVVSAEGISSDLEAYREAGIGGVQQFHVGGPDQGLICDTTNAIGTDNWKALMRHALNECERLGLTFGTHNCPGWSSSAFTTVTPEYSMQKLVWTDTIVKGGRLKDISVSQPVIDPQYTFYRDISLLAMPVDSVIPYHSIIDLNENCELLPEGQWRIIRIGHTTNGKTNEATAPLGGVGLECDKMSREAVRRYWNSYPQMLIDLLSETIGKTFQRIEIDSYEAGGQEWTPKMPEEFYFRRGYDMTKWLPVLLGYTIDSPEKSRKFFNDYVLTGTELFAENYYGYMAELAHENGLKLLYQPYGTGSSKPFNPINTEEIAKRLPDDLFCTEFWYEPSNWGWPSVPRHTATAHKLGIDLIYAEGFTCWPFSPWKEDPASLKVMADKAFCLGVNALMLHAGAQNPWKGAKPGMTFGKWGTWWTPGQTWWQSGGAKLLFDYFSRCQSLLQRGKWIADHKNGEATFTADQPLEWIHRRNNNTDIYFVANPVDSAFTTIITLPFSGKIPEIWFPETGETEVARAWVLDEGNTRIAMNFDEHQSCFIILRNETEEKGPGLTLPEAGITCRMPIDGEWTLSFPEGWDAPTMVMLNELVPWNEHSNDGIKYFSGTASYSKDFQVDKINSEARYLLDLGEVKNLAQVFINEVPIAHLWKKPFVCDITEYIKEGNNSLNIAVTNLWPNRMIGDEQYEDDVEWDELMTYSYASDSPVVGRYMKKVPDWLRNGEPRPSQHRRAVISFKFFEKDAPLLPSGLLGPVEIKEIKDTWVVKHQL